ncbi:ATP-binding protein [Seminavis robusta]|uniref:ATP-binding protein n=1 Tax=Seminavis robusta TaxID=568900 RepID=A0A9N8H4K6_9STRA|nr:ATP-binding protein [Seminavis robusta]|eukprot:Sro86_g045810.1 ATP-binding protein (1065) ;mRNA; f:87271-90652
MIQHTLFLHVTFFAFATEASLVFQAFEPVIPCADGSPAGIYSNVAVVNSNSQTLQLIDETKHIIVFEGGGACTNPDECLEKALSEPFKFSSTTLPPIIEGTTILSEDPQVENPFQSYTKWLVPYCTQDLFLGDVRKGKVGDFIHGGSDIFRTAISHWQDRAFQQGSIQQLVVIGISAGAIGVMNHVADVREAAQSVGVTTMQYILDAPSASDRWHDKNFSLAMETYVNLTEHPLCDMSNKFSQHYNPEISDLPCCVSSHCMFRHDENIRSIGTPKNTSGTMMVEEVLLLDGDYDPFALAASSQKDHVNQRRFIDIMSNVWAGAETAGSRITRPLETSLWLSDSQDEHLGPKGSWYISSCVAHGFFVPSVQLLHLACSHGNFSSKDFDVRCGSDGFGVQSTIGQVDLKVTLWQTTDTWNLAKVQGQSIHSIVAGFVSQDEDGQQESNRLVVLADECSGPNCASVVGHPNECQALFELEETFVPVPLDLTILWYIAISFIIATAAARLPLPKLFAEAATAEATEPVATEDGTSECHVSHDETPVHTKICSVVNLSIVTAEQGFKVLEDVHLEIRSGSVAGLFGRSGSGKSTLMAALSRQKLQGLSISAGKIEMHCPESDVAFLRQSDSVKMENMTASAYLDITASIYGAEIKQVTACSDMVKKLYCRGGQSGLNPFSDTEIKNLSGGQRRILAIATTLLLTPKLVLLDEPLSGLDDASSLQVMEFVQFLSNAYNCAVILSVHNPSEEVLKYLDRIIVLDNGLLKMERDCASNRAFALNFRRKLGAIMNGYLGNASSNVPPENQPKILEMTRQDSLVLMSRQISMADMSTSIETFECGEQKQEDVESLSQVRYPTSVPTTVEEESQKITQATSWAVLSCCYKNTIGFLYKTSFLCQRLHANYGSDLADLLSLPIILMLFAMVLRFDGGSPIQEILVSTFYIGLPVNLFRHKIHLSCKMWTAHRVEMDDRRVSVLSYQLASQTFSFSVPLFSLIVAHILGYVVLGWSFESLAVQILFSAVHLLEERSTFSSTMGQMNTVWMLFPALSLMEPSLLATLASRLSPQSILH